MEIKNTLSDYCVAITTLDDFDQAQQIARQLVQQKLAACVNIIPKVCSVYEWQGQIEEATEVVLIIKTRWQNWPQLSATIADWHPYEVPELIALNIEAGVQDYLSWITQATTAFSASVED